MTYDTYRYIFYVTLSLTVIMFVVSIVLFLKLEIRKVIAELSGVAAKKAIEDIRNKNMQDEVLTGEPPLRTTDEIQSPQAFSPQQDFVQRSSDTFSQNNSLDSSSYAPNSDATQQKNYSQEFNSNMNAMMAKQSPEYVTQETALLDAGDQKDNGIEILEEITFIHSTEIIM